MKLPNPIAATYLLALASVLPAQVLSAPESIQSVSGGFLRGLEMLDGNGDGLLDVLRVTTSGIQFLPGNGLGGFGAPIVTALPNPFDGFATSMRCGDVNADGLPDVVWPAFTGIFVRLGDGSGAFPGAGSVDPSVQGNINLQPILMDWNVDGAVDIVFFDGLGQLTFAPGDGAGNFGALQPIAVPVGVLLPAFGAQTAVDLDADGDQELVLTGTTLVILHPDGLGGVGDVTSIPAAVLSPGSATIHSLAGFVDHDQDGRLDLLLSGNAQILPVLADGLGGFLPGLPIPLSEAVTQPRGTDLDGDGLLDVVGFASPYSVLVFQGTAGGGFAAAQSFPAYSTTAFPDLDDLASGLAVGDLDGDGRGDVCTVGFSGVLSTLRNIVPHASGLSRYGSGTPTCRGTMGLTGSRRPSIGASDFAVLCSNAPAVSVGLLALGTRVTDGWDPLGLGIVLHLGFASPVAAATSDVVGAARFPLPIPALPLLIGLRVHAQTVWLGEADLGDTCSSGQYELASSRGLSIRLLP